MTYDVYFTTESVERHILNLLDVAAIHDVDLKDCEPVTFFTIETQAKIYSLQLDRFINVGNCFSLSSLIGQTEELTEMYDDLGSEGHGMKVLAIEHNTVHKTATIIADLYEDFFQYHDCE